MARRGWDSNIKQKKQEVDGLQYRLKLWLSHGTAIFHILGFPLRHGRMFHFAGMTSHK